MVSYRQLHQSQGALELAGLPELHAKRHELCGSVLDVEDGLRALLVELDDGRVQVCDVDRASLDGCVEVHIPQEAHDLR